MFTQGDNLNWQRQRSDCETYAGQTEIDYQRLVQYQHRDTVVAEAVDKPTKKMFVNPRVLSNYEVSEETVDQGWVNRLRSKRSITYTNVNRIPHVVAKKRM